jgi:hypothetical protein
MSVEHIGIDDHDNALYKKGLAWSLVLAEGIERSPAGRDSRCKVRRRRGKPGWQAEHSAKERARLPRPSCSLQKKYLMDVTSPVTATAPVRSSFLIAWAYLFTGDDRG